MCGKQSFSIYTVIVLLALISACLVHAYDYASTPPGDFNADYIVDFEDLKVLADDWLVNAYDLPGPSPTALVSHYEFDGNAADTVGGNNGTEVGNPTYAAGRYNQAISLDGDGDYVNCGNDASFNITSAVTISAWFKGTFDGSLGRIIEKGYNWMLCSGYGDNAAFYCLGFGILEGSATVNDNQWHHVAGVFDGSKMYLYVDGDVDAVKTAAGSLKVSTSNVYIGGNTSRSFNGLIDDVRIYSRALSEAEIELLAGLLATDLNTDGVVNLNDFAQQAQQWLSPVTFNAYAQWSNGPPTGAGYFPLAVWLQRPEDAVIWKQAGVNLYIGLWDGPTDTQLTTLRSAGMQVIASQNSTSLAWNDVTLADGSPLIIGYLQQDEPDNCQSDGNDGWGPPVPTSTIQQRYYQMKASDPTKPVLLNLSQGLGWDSGTWPGQGGYITPAVDYPQYILGSDIVGFDIYPMNCSRAETCDDAWRVALGVDRLHQYSPPGHIVWNCIETGDVSANDHMATVEEIKAEVWMSIIHGSTGIIYFIHGKSSYGDFDDRALLRPEYADRLAGVTAINNRVHDLAPVLNSPNIEGAATIQNLVGTTPVDFIVKRYGSATYLFAAAMREPSTTKLFTLSALPDTTIDVLDEGRQLSLTNGQFQDTFVGFQAHLYKINAAP